MSKVRNLIGGGKAFFCPGCESVHAVNTCGPRWEYNDNADAPTFSPSILVTYNGSDAGEIDSLPETCHSFVRDGHIQFLSDCTHKLAGTTVTIPEWPYAPNSYGGIDE
ncbi:MAG: DUF6527 family protein [Acidocella sp.]|nr:DUF6527 family protein [Acidocella sp.]